MTLMRPNQQLGPSLIQEPHLEMHLEQQILAELKGVRTDVQGQRDQLRELRTSLMGKAEDGEVPTGRFPKVESDLRDLQTRISILERAQVSALAYWNLARLAGLAVAGLVGSIAHALIEKLWSK